MIFLRVLFNLNTWCKPLSSCNSRRPLWVILKSYTMSAGCWRQPRFKSLSRITLWLITRWTIQNRPFPHFQFIAQFDRWHLWSRKIPSHRPVIITLHWVNLLQNPISSEILKAVAGRVVSADKNDILLLDTVSLDDTTSPFEIPTPREVGTDKYLPSWVCNCDYLEALPIWFVTNLWLTPWIWLSSPSLAQSATTA